MRRIAIICAAISPHLGSEFSVAWNFVMRMSKSNELYVIYGNTGYGFGNVESIKQWEKDHPNPNLHFIDIQLPNNKYHEFLRESSIKHDKSVLNIAHMLREKAWHKCAYKKVEELNKSGKIDLIHYLNPIGFKEAGYAWKIKDIPYGWGPIAGAHKRVWDLQKDIPLTKRLITHLLRNIGHVSLFKYDNRVKKAIKRCDFILGATPTTVDQIQQFHKKEAIYLPENGIMKMNTTSPINCDINSELQLIWIGGMEERKALKILLRALCLIKNKKWHLNIIGDGPQRNELIQFAEENNLNSQITWYGKLTRLEVMDILKKSHLHIISSLGEATTTVLFEAMSFAVPTLSLDHCGMAGVICNKCGIKIPIHSYDQVIHDIAENIKTLIFNPEKVNLLSKGVLECSKKYLYDNRIALFENIYDEAIKKYNLIDNENNISQ